MNKPSRGEETALAPNFAAPQHGPRPLPLFLSLLREETAANPERMTRALEGLRRYQNAKRPPRPAPKPAIAERHGAALRDYGGSGPPVLFVPSLINPPNVLDLDRGKSLLGWLSGQERRVLLLDWSWPGPDRHGLSVAGHIEEILLPLMEAVGEQVDLVGYCLGGTMAVAAAQLSGARSLVTLAAPWHFSSFPEGGRTKLAGLWRNAKPATEKLGVLPMEVLQCAFWSLDPARTVAKFEEFAAMEGVRARAFVTLEDWANDGPPVSAAAAREMFADFFERDLPGSGRWQVAGQTIEPRSLNIPVLNIVSATDRIVPAASAIRGGDRIEVASGHVGMIVGARAREAVWEPLAAWLSRGTASC